VKIVLNLRPSTVEKHCDESDEK